MRFHYNIIIYYMVIILSYNFYSNKNRPGKPFGIFNISGTSQNQSLVIVYYSKLRVVFDRLVT